MSKNKDSRKAAYKKAREAYESMNAAQRGELLTAMIALYQKNQTQQNLLPVMQCLMDNVPVGVPMKVSQEDMEMIKAARDNKENAQQIKVSMKTVVLRHKDGRAYFPVFSRRAEVPEEFFGKYYWLQIPFKECAKMLNEMKEVNEIVINTFTQKLIMPREALENILLVDNLRPSDEVPAQDGGQA